MTERLSNRNKWNSRHATSKSVYICLLSFTAVLKLAVLHQGWVEEIIKMPEIMKSDNVLTGFALTLHQRLMQQHFGV